MPRDYHEALAEKTREELSKLPDEAGDNARNEAISRAQYAAADEVGRSAAPQRTADDPPGAHAERYEAAKASAVVPDPDTVPVANDSGGDPIPVEASKPLAADTGVETATEKPAKSTATRRGAQR